jgi:hypothetical protein
VSDGAVFLSAFDGLFVSSNAGAVWSQPQTRVGLVTALAFSPNFAIDQRVMASNYAEGGLYSSADRGDTWARHRRGVASDRPILALTPREPPV